VLELLRARQGESGLTIVWATHDLALARRFADATLDLDPEGPEVRLRAS
jgi:ABC-type cobalamin/Fe3+-siderophores transport system ATPase subunit